MAVDRLQRLAALPAGRDLWRCQTGEALRDQHASRVDSCPGRPPEQP